LRGNGHLYWNGGMRRAFGAAIERDYDYYLWMNDDTSLDDGALALLLEVVRGLRDRGEEAVIVAGSTRHPETGKLTYGGVVHSSAGGRCGASWSSRGRAAPVQYHERQRDPDLPGRGAPHRQHRPGVRAADGDFDYGLRARAAGCSVWVAPGTVGTCASHPERRPGERPFFVELQELWSVKTLPPGLGRSTPAGGRAGSGRCTGQAPTSAVYAVLAPRRPFATDHGRLLSSRR
jgi:hypothetical protein